MADENLESIKKLPLKERLEKLKTLEDKWKKELDAASKLLKESMEEEKKAKFVESVEVPDSQEVDISDLFKIKGDELEAVIAREAPKEVDEDTVKYELMLDYKLLGKMADEMGGSELAMAMDKVKDRINDLADKITYSNMSRDVADQLVATRSVLYTMKKKMGM